MAFIVKMTDTNNVTGLVGSALYGKCDTAAATAAKVGTLSDFDSLIHGTTIHMKMKYANTAANPTLNVNSTGAKAIYRYGTTAPGTNATESWPDNQVVSFTYIEDTPGTASTGHWYMNDQLALTTTSIGSASTGTAIFADDITAWDAGTPGNVITTETKSIPNVTSVGSAPTLGDAFTVPNVTSAGSASSMTKSNVTFDAVSSTTSVNAIPSATISEGVLTFGTPQETTKVTTASKTATYISAWNAGSAPTLGTAFTIPNVTSVGSAPTLGDAIEVESVKTNTAGTAPSLTYTSRSIPNISVTSKTVVTPKT